MPTNKNALARIAFLDALLADRHHDYSLDDLTEKCKERLVITKPLHGSQKTVSV